MLDKICEGELFESILAISDVSSIFNILPKSEYIILGRLIKLRDNAESDGKIYLENLKRELNVPMAIVSEIIQNMSDDGLVMWKLDPHNKKTYVELANNGVEQYNRQNEGIRKYTKKIDDILSDEERDVLYSTVKKVADMFAGERDKEASYYQFFRGDLSRDMNIIGLLKPKESVTYIINDSSISDALAIFGQSGYTTIPVVEPSGKYAGTISEGDLLRYISENGMDKLDEASVSSIVNVKRNPAVNDFADSSTIVHGILSQNFLSLVNDDNMFMGIITRKDVIKFLREKAEKHKR